MITKFEVLDDVLDVWRETIEVILEVGKELLLTAPRFEIAQGEARSVVKGLARGIAKRSALLGDARVVENLLGVEHLLLGWFEHRIHAPDDAHRQDDVRIFAALEEVAEHVVGDTPDKGDDLIVRCLIHYCFRSISVIDSCWKIAPAQPSKAATSYNSVRLAACCCM